MKTLWPGREFALEAFALLGVYLLGTFSEKQSTASRFKVSAS